MRASFPGLGLVELISYFQEELVVRAEVESVFNGEEGRGSKSQKTLAVGSFSASLNFKALICKWFNKNASLPFFIEM